MIERSYLLLNFTCEARVSEEAPFTDDELLAYLDEMLPGPRMARVEATARQSPALRQRLVAVARRRESGAHTVGEIWREERLSCPGRSRLGSYLLSALPREEADYITFHIETIGCRYCQANLDDLRRQSREDEEPARRKRRYFESSAGHLRRYDHGSDRS